MNVEARLASNTYAGWQLSLPEQYPPPVLHLQFLVEPAALATTRNSFTLSALVFLYRLERPTRELSLFHVESPSKQRTDPSCSFSPLSPPKFDFRCRIFLGFWLKCMSSASSATMVGLLGCTRPLDCCSRALRILTAHELSFRAYPFRFRLAHQLYRHSSNGRQKHDTMRYLGYAPHSRGSSVCDALDDLLSYPPYQCLKRE